MRTNPDEGGRPVKAATNGLHRGNRVWADRFRTPSFIVRRQSRYDHARRPIESAESPEYDQYNLSCSGTTNCRRTTPEYTNRCNFAPLGQNIVLSGGAD